MEYPNWRIECRCGVFTRTLQGEHWISGKGTFSLEDESKTALAKMWNQREANRG